MAESSSRTIGSDTYAVLDVSADCFREIQQKLEAAGYQHAFTEDDDGSLVINLHGIAIRDEDGDEGPSPFTLPPTHPTRRTVAS